MILHVFDMDETLFTHKERIRVVVHGPYGERRLTGPEYDSYTLHTGEHFTFHEWRSSRKFEESAEPIVHILEHLISLSRQDKVAIVTARSDFDDMLHFKTILENHGIDTNRVGIHMAGNLPFHFSNGQKKYQVLDKLITEHGYQHISLYDDSINNLVEFITLKDKHPHLDLKAFHISHEDRVVVREYPNGVEVPI